MSHAALFMKNFGTVMGDMPIAENSSESSVVFINAL
jgi:hypothetical protein